MKTFTFLNIPCAIAKSHYASNGKLALEGVASHTDPQGNYYEGEPVVRITVNSDDTLKPGEFIVKTWSENEGLLGVLMGAEIVQPTGQQIVFGHGCLGAVCKFVSGCGYE